MKHLSNNDYQDNLLTNVPDGINPQDATNVRQLDGKINGDGIDTVTVSEIEPTSPQNGDIWIDEADSISGARFKAGAIDVKQQAIVTVDVGFEPTYIEFEGIIGESNANSSGGTGFYSNDEHYSLTSTTRNSSAITASASRYYDDCCLTVISYDGAGNLTRGVRLNPLEITPTGFRVNVQTSSTVIIVRYKAYKI